MDGAGSSACARAPGFAPAELAARVDARVLAAWRAVERDEWAELARRLRAAGLVARAVVHVCGVVHPLYASRRALIDASTQPPLADAPRASLMALLWAAGAHLTLEPVRACLGSAFARLCELGLLHTDGERVAATVSMIPVTDAMVVSDRADVRRGRETALVADDSALHTIGALPARASRPDIRWLDVGTGSAVVPLAHPGAAARILGTDINPRALAMAELGAALGRVAHIELVAADLWPSDPDAEPARWHRITFNAPIPDGAHDDIEAEDAPELPWYRYGAPDILTRFFAGAAERVTEDAEVLVHSVVPESDVPPWLGQLPGHVMVVRYTPPGMSPAFGMTAWCPGRPRARFLKEVALSATTPHVTRAMLEL